MIVAALLTELGDANFDPPSGGIMLVLYWLAVVTGVSVGLGSFRCGCGVCDSGVPLTRVRVRATNPNHD